MKSILTLIVVTVCASSFAQCPACTGDAKKQQDEFMAIARQMELKAEGKQECCKSTAEKPVAKGGEGCCSEKGTPAKFKVFANGKYKYFGCADSAAKARKEMLAQGSRPGKVQKVRTRVLMS